jgi:cholesterol oxidase
MASRVVRFVRELLLRGETPGLAEQIFRLMDLEAVRNALVYLAMGIDAADGELRIDEEGELQLGWNHENSMKYWRRVEEVLRAISENKGLDGNLMLNPTWSFRKQVLTLHPLGGCPMGDDATRGVVSPEGKVFNYDGLYVIDGSIIPTALGPNPSKTIGAVAERALDHMIGEGI